MMGLAAVVFYLAGRGGGGVSRKKIGELLVEQGALSQDRLQLALAADRTGQRLGEYLVAQGWVTEVEVTEALALQFQLPCLRLVAAVFEPEAVAYVDEQVARRYQVVPVRLEGRCLHVASADPLNVQAVDDLSFLTGMQVAMALMPPTEIKRALDRIYVQGEYTPGTMTSAQGRRSESGGSVVRLVDSLLQQAIDDAASDIHIERQRDEVCIRYRIDGGLQTVNFLDKDVHPNLVARVKVLAGMDIAERRLPLDGAFSYEYAGRLLDVRVATLPTIYGEKVVMRLFDPEQQLASYADLGLSPQQAGTLSRMLTKPAGLILVCGPTGSGKTTTLRVMLQGLNNSSRNIISIEDPVEYEINGINHVQVQPRIGLTFASLLRSVLRQDPDVIMVGEMRDRETVDIALRAALTGHLVLTSLHTTDAPAAIIRLLDMGAEPYMLASCLTGVVAQNLVRRLCRHCAQPFAAVDSYRLSLVEEKELWARSPGGCSRCRQTGYQGRIGLFEIMLLNERLRQLILQRATLAQLQRVAQQTGMLPLRQDGLIKVRQGITSLEEVIRVTL